MSPLDEPQPMYQFLGGPWAGRTLPPGDLPKVVRVPVAQPLTLQEGSGGMRIARYVRHSWYRDDLLLFEGWEDGRP